MISTCSRRSSIWTPSLRAISGTWWFCSSRRCSVTIFSVIVPSRPRCRICSHRHSCRSRAATPIGSKVWMCCSAFSTSRDRPVGHGGDLFDRRHQVAVVIEVADDRAADLLQLLVAGLERELPHQVIGERSGGREGVLDRRQLLDLLRRARAVAVVEIVAEEIFVVGVVPGVGLLGGRLLGGPSRPAACSAGWSSSVGTSSSSGFSTISWFRRSASSSVDIGSSLIACCNDGVRMSF